MRLETTPRHGTGFWLVGKLVGRVLFAAFVVFGTYNPTGRSYYQWIQGDAGTTWKVIASGLLAVSYVVALPITWRALGFGGIILTISLATTVIWVTIEAGWIDLRASEHAYSWITLSVLAFVLGVGLSWMLLARVFDGQLRVRDISR